AVTYHPAEFTCVVGPSVPITGVVRNADTGEPLAGVTVKSHGISGWLPDFVRAVTDARGRYRLEGMPIAADNTIVALALGDEPYLTLRKQAPTQSDQDELEVDFDLPMGVWLEGSVTDKQTGRGLTGSM